MPTKNPVLLAAKQARNFQRHKTERIAYTNNYRRRLTGRIVSLFGGKCAKCGFSDSRALQIDHRNGVPKDERKWWRGGKGLYAAILRGDRKKEDFQLLCANCNWIKRVENGEHTGWRAK